MDVGFFDLFPSFILYFICFITLTFLVTFVYFIFFPFVIPLVFFCFRLRSSSSDFNILGICFVNPYLLFLSLMVIVYYLHQDVHGFPLIPL